MREFVSLFSWNNTQSTSRVMCFFFVDCVLLFFATHSFGGVSLANYVSNSSIHIIGQDYSAAVHLIHLLLTVAALYRLRLINCYIHLVGIAEQIEVYFCCELKQTETITTVSNSQQNPKHTIIQCIIKNKNS